MPSAAKYITIEGQFANGVLGTFRIIRRRKGGRNRYLGKT